MSTGFLGFRIAGILGIFDKEGFLISMSEVVDASEELSRFA